MIKWESIPRVIAPQIIPTKHQVTEKIGDTLFVDGRPYVTCGRCNMPVEQHGVYKITMLRRWLKVEESQGFDLNGCETIKIKHKPVLYTAFGCFDCWNQQQNEKELNKVTGRMTFFNEPNNDKR